MFQANKPSKKNSEDFGSDDDVMMDDHKEVEEKPKEIITLSSNPLIQKLGHVIPFIIEALGVQPQSSLESTMGYEVKIFGQKRLALSQLLNDIILLEIEEF